MNAIEDLSISNISIISGMRAQGRTSDHTLGRKRSGILFIFSGEACFFVDKKKQAVAQSGDLFFLPKGCRYKMQYTAPSTTFVLIDLDLFDKGKSALLTEEIAPLARDDSSCRIATIIANLEICGTARNLSANFRRKELVYKLLGEIYRTGVSLPGKHGNPRILAGVMLLEQSFLENLPVTQFADACNISISLFRTLFHQQYGMSPVQYRNYLRIRRAAELLTEGSCTVSEAAFACGFYNIGYFCRYYKKVTGQTPMETKQGKH